MLAASIFHRGLVSIGQVKAAAGRRRRAGAAGRASPRERAPPRRGAPTASCAGIVQDAADGRVLMLGWLDAEALAATVATGLVHFHSRSRGRLWRKGETSGHELRLRDLALDCDGDALLLTVDRGRADLPYRRPVVLRRRPASRRRAARSTRTAPPRSQGFAWLETLWATIRVARRGSPRRLLHRPAARRRRGCRRPQGRRGSHRGPHGGQGRRHAERLGGDRAATRAALAGELADLVYHALVLCAERSLPPVDVIAVLRERHAAG